MDKLVLRAFQITDISALQSVAITTFQETYTESCEASDMEKYIQTSFHIATLEKELLHSQSLFYGIWLYDTPLAYMKLNLDTQTELLTDKSSLEIQRIYVLKKFQGQHLGSILLEKANEIALQYRRDFIWLVVWAENEKAIRFYQKKGFEVAGTVPFKLGDTIHQDYCMIKNNE